MKDEHDIAKENRGRLFRRLLKKFITKGNTTEFNRGIPFFSVYW